MNRFILIGIATFLITACADPGGGNAGGTPAPTCIEHLKGHTFELYRLDTQSFRIADGKPSGPQGTILTDSNSSNYRTFVYNQAGDSLTVNNRSFSSTRTFLIKKDTAYWGDDVSIILTCSETDYNTWTYSGTLSPDTYLKVTGYTRRIR